MLFTAPSTTTNFRSDEVGLGPYTDNYWDLVVRNGKITSVAGARAYITNGSSAERWEPFQRWVASTHPEDLQTMYPVGELRITEEAIRLWDRAHPGVGGGGEGRRRVTGKGRRGCLAVFLVLLAGAWVGSASSLEAASVTAAAARPPRLVEVSGPVQGGTGQATTAVQDLPSLGYTESEFFFGGTATAYVGDAQAQTGSGTRTKASRPTSGPG